MFAHSYQHHSVPPPTYMAYQSPRHGVYATPPREGPRNHSRRASEGPTAAYSYYASPPPLPPSYAFPPQQQYAYVTPEYFATKHASPRGQHTNDYVSPSNEKYTYRASVRSKTSRFAADQDGYKQPRQRASNKTGNPKHSRSYKYDHHVEHHYDELDDEDYCYGHDYSPEGSPPPPYNAAEDDFTYRSANAYASGAIPQEKTYSSRHPTDTPPAYRSSTRPRANTFTSHQRREPQSFSSKPQSSPPKSSSKRPQTAQRPSSAQQPQQSPPKATAADAARAGIPAGYSYKNWDPTEEPIFLLGSVFDANSLGRWIYDWTVFCHEPATPMADLAGDLWLLLIQLAGKIKRAEECRPRIRRRENRDCVDDFLESGERLWARLSKILKACEEFMWREAKKENGGKKTVAMGPSSGCEFVDSIFGRNRKLLETEKLMAGIRLWSMRFDVNCEDILRHPSR